jgi:flagellar M-ring protein FliF
MAILSTLPVPDYREQLTTFWNGLDASRRKVLGGAVGASLIAIAAVGFWASQPAWTPLTRITDGDTRGQVQDKLSAAGVQWRLGDDGQTVEVLAQELGAARKEASGGHGLVGLGGVDQLDPWITPFQEQLQKQKMLQEELVLQINGIDGVAASRVLLNLRAGTGFLGDSTRSSASVSVKSDEGATLSRDLGKSIALLVSHSVAGMTPDDVTVVDQRTGRLIWSTEGALETQSAIDEAARRSKRLEEQATTALAAVLGSPDRVRVSVTVELDGTSTQSTVNAVDPETAAPMREKSESDQNSSAGESNTNGGEAGVQSNQPQAAVAATSSGTARKREETDTQYQYTTTQTTTVKPAGELKRVSAAVFLDSAAVAAIAKAGGMEPEAYQATLEKAALAAIGADPARGDQVVVSFVPFAEETMIDATAVAAFPWERLVPAAVALLAIVLTFFGVVRPLMRNVLARPARDATAANGEPTGAEVGANGPRAPGIAARGAAHWAAAANEQVDNENVIDLAERLRRQVESFKHVSAADVSALVNRETDHSAEVLRRWVRS